MAFGRRFRVATFTSCARRNPLPPYQDARRSSIEWTIRYIEGRVVDSKPFDCRREGAAAEVSAGSPLHDMSLVVNDQFVGAT
jgi:hypothetical protein